MDELYDIAIIGCGPAGLSAAINCKIRNKNILIFGTELCSAKMHKSPYIFNYLGHSKIKGEDLRQQFLKHIEDAGVILTKGKVDNVLVMGDEFNVLSGDKIYRAKSVIVATGINYGKAIKGETEYLGRGVGYCATCDAPLYKGKTVALVAYTNEGEEEAGFLSEVCKKVYYVPVYKELGTLSNKVEVIKDDPVEIIGDSKVTHLVLKTSKLEVDGVFIIKETVSPEQLVPGLVMDGPHIKVDRNMMTNIKGLYAAGDCAGKPYQLSKASGEGQIAALHAVGYIDKKH
ncbi:MAG: NAD(P)/FAD-dependent oxidoreductase [Caulobacteraceae bacterium]